MALTEAAIKLLKWFGRYKVTPVEYEEYLSLHPKAIPHGEFVDAFANALAEDPYGYYYG